MGTDPAGLQERLEAALDPALVIERELGDGAISRAFLLNDARLGRRTCSSCGRIRLVDERTHAAVAAHLTCRSGATGSLGCAAATVPSLRQSPQHT